MARITYLQTSFSIVGRSCLTGRVLYDHFRSQADAWELGALILPQAEAEKWHKNVRDDIVTEEDVVRLSFDAIYIEGGLFADLDEETWKVRREFVEQFVRQGGVLIVADADVNDVRRYRRQYREIGNFTASQPHFLGDEPVYGIDESRNVEGRYYQVRSLVPQMIIDDWLQPVYEGIESIAVSHPVDVVPHAPMLATGNKDTSATLHMDTFVDKHDAFPFATVNQFGLGYVAFIARTVSSDHLVKESDNARWLWNLINFLTSESRLEVARRTSLRQSSHLLFLSHRHTDKPFVEATARALKLGGVNVWLDREQLTLGDSLTEGLNAGLGDMTGFVLFWSRKCIGAPWVKRELNAAVARAVAENMAIFVVALDDTPVPPIIGDYLRVRADQLDPYRVARELDNALRQRAVRAK